jgi:L-ribulose-5-phosphate 3-epimerase
MTSYKDFTFGLYEKALPARLDWPERLNLAKEAGYDFIEISIDESDERLERLDWDLVKKQELVRAVHTSGVFIPTMCLSGHRRYPIGSTHTEIRTKGMEVMKKAIEFASDTGIRIVQLAGYDAWYDEPSTKETADFFLENLETSLKWASSLGVTLAIESMGIEFMESLEKIMFYVNRFNSPYLQAYPDIGNLSAMDMDIRREFKLAEGHIVAIHIKDTTPGIVRRIPFDEGTVDFIEAFKAIKDSGFTGPVVVEMWADEKDDTVEEVRAAKAFIIERMDKVWHETAQ